MSDLTTGLKATGVVNFKVYDQDGNLKEDITVKNLVVTAGLAVIADRMKGTPLKAAMTHMALGSSSTTPAAGDTALGTQLGTRVALSSTTVTGAEITYSATFAAGTATGAVVEAGVFNASTSGDMLCRTTFPVINKNSTDSLAVTWKVTVS